MWCALPATLWTSVLMPTENSGLPPITPRVGFQNRLRLPWDYYASVLGNDYSVDPSGIGRMVTVNANLTTVTVELDGRLLASHERVWGSNQTITDPGHVTSAARLRTVFQSPRPTVSDESLLRNLGD